MAWSETRSEGLSRASQGLPRPRRELTVRNTGGKHKPMLPARHALRTTALVACALLVAACTQGFGRRETKAPTPPAPIEQHSRKGAPAPATARPEARSSGTRTPATAARDTGDLWGRLPSLFTLDGAGRPEVAREIEWLSNNPAYVEKVSLNAAPYLFHVVNEIEDRKLPGELALLPILESGYDASARSPYGAVGLWQFMGGTGDKMGLGVTPWFDGRADVEKSTRAALEYLEVLKKQFGGDWLLAIAAYNMGWGTVERSLANQRRRGGDINFWTLEGTRTSRQLVARLLALASVLRDRERYALRFLPIPNRPYFGRLPLARPADLAQLPARLGLPPEVFRRLNPGWRRGHTGPVDEAHLLVPLDRLEAARAVMAALPESPVPALPPPTRRGSKTAPAGQLAGNGASVHRVAAGDSLWTIATQHGVSVEKLLAANPALTRKSVLALGQAVQLPSTPKLASAVASPAGSRAVATTDKPAQRAGGLGKPAAEDKTGKTRHYKVKQGDSLWTIARQFKVSIDDLLAWNRLKRDAQLNLGQDLVVSPAG